MFRALICSLVLLTLTIILGCNKDEVSKYEVLEVYNAKPKGSRILGMDISYNEDGFESSVVLAMEAGTEFIEINLAWNSLEENLGQYRDPFGEIIVNSTYYGSRGIDVAFCISPIDRHMNKTPQFLSQLPLDDSLVMQSFTDMIDWFMLIVPNNVSIPYVSIGNLPDNYLNDSASWRSYIGFYHYVAKHFRENYPDIVTGVKTNAIKGVLGGNKYWIDSINQFSDVVMLSYYPHDDQYRVMDTDIAIVQLKDICNEFAGRRIFLNDVGYHSGSRYGRSSQEKQAHFYHYLFAAWDSQIDQIERMRITWLHEQTTDTINAWRDLYGSNSAMIEYFSNLGIREYESKPKCAWLQIMEELDERNW